MEAASTSATRIRAIKVAVEPQAEERDRGAEELAGIEGVGGFAIEVDDTRLLPTRCAYEPGRCSSRSR
jgi:hypothetical protein